MPLNVVQSVFERSPAVTLPDVDAIGMFKVCVLVAELHAGAVPVVPIARLCAMAERPFRLPILPLKLLQSLELRKPFVPLPA